MLTSDNQLKSNRRNAKKSTGPKTKAGKAKSSRNALKHGCYSDDIIIRSSIYNEDANDYACLLASITDKLKPDNYFEETIVAKIANTLWRSRRVIAAETAHIEDLLDDLSSNIQKAESFREKFAESAGREYVPRSRRAFIHERDLNVAQSLVPDRRYTHDLQLYEMRLDRQLAQLYRLYYTIKKNSVAETVPCTPQLAVGESCARHVPPRARQIDDGNTPCTPQLAVGESCARHVPPRARQIDDGNTPCTPQLAVGEFALDRNAHATTKTTETNPTPPEPQPLTPPPTTNTTPEMHESHTLDQRTCGAFAGTLPTPQTKGESENRTRQPMRNEKSVCS